LDWKFPLLPRKKFVGSVLQGKRSRTASAASNAKSPLRPMEPGSYYCGRYRPGNSPTRRVWEGWSQFKSMETPKEFKRRGRPRGKKTRRGLARRRYCRTVLGLLSLARKPDAVANYIFRPRSTFCFFRPEYRRLANLSNHGGPKSPADWFSRLGFLF